MQAGPAAVVEFRAGVVSCFCAWRKGERGAEGSRRSLTVVQPLAELATAGDDSAPEEPPEVPVSRSRHRPEVLRGPHRRRLAERVGRGSVPVKSVTHVPGCTLGGFHGQAGDGLEPAQTGAPRRGLSSVIRRIGIICV